MRRIEAGDTKVDVDQLRGLLDLARRVGKQDTWADVVLKWAENAERLMELRSWARIRVTADEPPSDDDGKVLALRNGQWDVRYVEEVRDDGGRAFTHWCQLPPMDRP